MIRSLLKEQLRYFRKRGSRDLAHSLVQNTGIRHL